jgi:hypothetical protein
LQYQIFKLLDRRGIDENLWRHPAHATH